REGSLFVSINGQGTSTIDEENCAFSFSGTATYRITGGTGIFQGARGQGTATFDGAFVGCERGDEAGVFFAKLMGNLRLRGSIAA
ncbi:MAG: hypothetical protein LC708_03735, partial [Actinobacteria bacterium]|nr:hypothetical protein [Actinomycetota bacterium]